MKRDVETYDTAAEFLAAQKRRGKARQKAQQARPDLPRASMGQGDHLAALMRLSALGWHFYTYWAKQHYFSKRDGTLGPICASYEAAIRETEAAEKAGKG